ncbi:MAG: 16S rRNA (uracil(1498)-N(3))-methyltransferase [Oscillospiraceae bacterium]|nr:16S rRNA (uracil(1498)-N(3))-methyltransferase [Oscillospiraceae bacterium]
MDIIERWRYPRFFSNDINLSETDLHHAKSVLRMKQGDKLIICDGKGTDYICEFGENIKIIETVKNETEPSIHIRLFQCLPKSDKMDMIVQKAVELGVVEIVPVISRRVIARSDKITRWNKIAYEAAKQCGRGIVPRVSEVRKFDEAVKELNNDTLGIIFYECGGERLNEILPKRDYVGIVPYIGMFIGSEGGFTEEEIELANSHGIVTATLGKRILRVETAPIVALSLLMNLTGNM